MYLPDASPIEPTIEDAPFWEAARAQRLVFQSCRACGRFRHPPLPRCAACGSDQIAWTEAPKDAELFSWTVAHAPPGLGVPVRYVIALVLFRALDNIRLVTNIIAPEPEKLGIGMPVELVWESYGDGYVPRFKGCAS